MPLAPQWKHGKLEAIPRPHRDIRYQAAIVRDHHILLVKVYDRTDGRQFWIVPGGGREPDEDAETCLRREVREETGLDIEPQRLRFVTPTSLKAAMPGSTPISAWWSGARHSQGSNPEDDHDGLATIRAVGWFDLRAPARWNPELATGTVTPPLLHQLRVLLDDAAG